MVKRRATWTRDSCPQNGDVTEVSVPSTGSIDPIGRQQTELVQVSDETIAVGGAFQNSVLKFDLDQHGQRILVFRF